MSNRVFGSDAARAVGRFQPEGPLGYRAQSVPEPTLRPTRAEAVSDEVTWWEARDQARELERLRDLTVSTRSLTTRAGSTFTVSQCRGWTRDELIEYNDILRSLT